MVFGLREEKSVGGDLMGIDSDRGIGFFVQIDEKG
jgi:hypothetical protein